MSGQDVVITGIGPMSPLGVGRAAFARTLDERIEPVEIADVRVEDYLQSVKTYLDPASELVLCSAALALKDARLTVTDQNADSVGMALGTRFGNLTTVESYLAMVRQQGVKLASPLLFIHAYPNTSVSLSAIEFSIRGTNFNFNSGRWCGLEALTKGFDELASGKMSVMLAAATDTYTEMTRGLALGRPLRAAATLVLERKDEALARKARPLAVVVGCGLAETEEDALSAALAQSRLDHGEIDWLLLDAKPASTHGSSARVHATELVELAGDSGAATALEGVMLASIALAEQKPPVASGLLRPPGTAAVVSADDSGAAAVILGRLAD
jgi:3-oxoacyl-(acyl-carrier-protein) synthase